MGSIFIHLLIFVKVLTLSKYKLVKLVKMPKYKSINLRHSGEVTVSSFKSARYIDYAGQSEFSAIFFYNL